MAYRCSSYSILALASASLLSIRILASACSWWKSCWQNRLTEVLNSSPNMLQKDLWLLPGCSEQDKTQGYLQALQPQRSSCILLKVYFMMHGMTTFCHTTGVGTCLLGFADGVPNRAFSAGVLVDAHAGLGPVGEAGTDGLQHLSIRQLASVLPLIDTDCGQNEYLQHTSCLRSLNNVLQLERSPHALPL